MKSRTLSVRLTTVSLSPSTELGILYIRKYLVDKWMNDYILRAIKIGHFEYGYNMMRFVFYKKQYGSIVINGNETGSNCCHMFYESSWEIPFK